MDVIVPCFNEDPRTLSACLESIANQDYAGKLRVYVVADGSANLDAVRPVSGRQRARNPSCARSETDCTPQESPLNALGEKAVRVRKKSMSAIPTRW
nr:glycosyltransferase family 2 protein [Paraburkholderia sp. BL8N3]